MEIEEHPVLSSTKHNILELIGYYARFYELAPYFKTDRAAWEHLEAEMKFKYGINRYYDVRSFYSARHRYIKGQQNRTDNINDRRIMAELNNV